MMKIRISHIGMLLATAFFGACTSETDILENIPQQEEAAIHTIQVTANDFEGAEHITRTTVEVGENGAAFAWAANDTIGIFPDTGYQVAFPMGAGAGTQTAEFDGGGWALKAASQYMAYYPFEYNNRSNKQIAISYVGQMQKGNGNTDHIGAYDYMAAAATTPKEGSVNFQFKHLGALVQWKLRVPAMANLTSMTIETKEHLFIRNGKLDLSSKQPVIESSDKRTSLSMELSNLATTAAGQEVTVYMMMAPMDLSGKTFTVAVTNDKGEVAKVELEGQKFEAGKAYALSAKLNAFEAATLQIADRRGKAIGMEGGTLSLDYLSNVECQAIISKDAQEWIVPTGSRAVTERTLTFEVKENTGNTNRRGTITIQSLKSNLAVEYTLIQGGQNTYAITETGQKLPVGILSAQYEPTDAKNGLGNLVDNNMSSYYEVAKSSFYIVWEGPEAVPVESFSFGMAKSGSCRPHDVSISISSDGNNWNGLGWGILFGDGEGSHTVNHDSKARSRFYKLQVSANHGGATTQIAEFGMYEDMEADKDITTLEELIARGSSFTQVDSTPMGRHYENRHVTTDEDRKWLANATNEPDLLPSASGYTLRPYEVNLYPYDVPLPADVNQHGIGDCSALAVFAEMAYLFPGFIQSIITDHCDGTYTVSMFDPQGKPVDVTIQSTFLGDDNGIGGTSGKDGKANWATILEKAIMKWNKIYQVNPDINGIGSEHVAPLFTGEGSSFAITPSSLLPEQLQQAAHVALANRMITIGGFTQGGLSVNGPQTVTAHAFSFMLSSVNEALFTMRNPWGNSPSGSKDDDGLLHIVNDGIVPSTIDMRIIYPGAALPYAVKDLTPYLPPQY